MQETLFDKREFTWGKVYVILVYEKCADCDWHKKNIDQYYMM